MTRITDGLLRCRGTRWRRNPLHVLVIPREIPLHPIALVARPLDAVVLVRIDNQLRINPETAQRLVHLLAALHGHIEVALAPKEECWRLNTIRVQERIRDLHISLPRFRVPRWTNLVIVLNDVLVGSIERNRKRGTGAARCRFESRVSRDQVISQNATITPATHTESVWISNTHLDHVIDTGE